MQNKDNIYETLIGQSVSVFKLSQLQIKEKYVDRPLCLMDYIEGDIHEKSIEIRFDDAKVSLNCAFDDDGLCDSVFLFADSEQLIEGFIGYLIENHDYSFIKSQFTLDNCFLKVKDQKNNLCLVFYR